MLPAHLSDGNLNIQYLATDTDIDRFEAALVQNFNEEECPVEHIFLPGLYIRKIFMRKGLCVTSKIHKTQHPFFIEEGDVSVYSENEGVVRYKTGHLGITTPGTRRVLLMHEYTRWATVHAATETTVEEIEERIIEKHDNPELAYERIIKALMG